MLTTRSPGPSTPRKPAGHAIIPVALSLLECPVRGCGLKLTRRDRALVCARRHSFDIARSGYVNLLQPNDRRSAAAGDSRQAVAARARLAAAGLSRTTTDRIVAIATSLLNDAGHERPESARTDPTRPGIEAGTRPGPGRGVPVVVDLGSGTGEVLAALACARSIAGVGIDLSTAAADHAARRFPDLAWVVANADRHIPLAAGVVDLVVSVHARRHAAECARVLVPHGHLIVAVAAPDDLIELREAVLGPRSEGSDKDQRDRAGQVIREHAGRFTLADRVVVCERQRVERDTLLDLLATTYRGARRSAAQKVRTLDALDVTLSTDVVVFARK